MSADQVRLSKFLSFVLRHEPQSVGLKLDPQGWASIDDLIAKGNAGGPRFSREELAHVVETSDKKRFSISADGLHIRAAQGHSVAVDLGLAPATPPTMLYHGTARRFLDSIMSRGLEPGRRQQVHLSIDTVTARRVGRRHGEPVILGVEASAMHAHGLAFFLADNGVWLTDHVPAEFLTLPPADPTEAATTSGQP